MKIRSLLVCVLLSVPAVAPGASKEIQDLQREINRLQLQLADLQKSQDDKLAQVLGLAQQAVDLATKANTGVAAVTANLNKALPAMTESLAAPTAQINSRLTEIGGDVRALQNAQTDQASTLARMQSLMDDIKRQLQTLNTPPPAPPSAQTDTGGSAPQTSAAPANPPMAALDMYNAAYGDYTTSKLDLASQGFNDFLKYYPNHNRAPNAHFYLGMIQYQAKPPNFPAALKEFDATIEYNGSKMEDAMLFKARALANMPGRKTDAATAFRQLIHDYPKADAAVSACEDLKTLGMNCPAPAAANHGTPKRSKK